MFVLVGGMADVSITSNSTRTHLAALHSGACFGEMSLLTGEKRSATITATADCEVAELNRTMLAEVFRQQPQVLQEISELLAKRKLETEGTLAAQGTAPLAVEEQRQYTAGFRNQLQALFRL